MVRTPCCKSEGLKKGAWTPEEDEKLTAYVQEHGEGGWRTLPEKAGLKRCGKSCRLRWANYLRPDIKRGQFSLEDEEIIIKLHAIKGNKWSTIARRLPGRTDNEIKNYWNTHIKKRLIQKGIDPITHKPINPGSDKEENGTTPSPSSISGSNSGSDTTGSVSGSFSSSVQLLNHVATKFSLNANRMFLAEIIQGTAKKNSNDNSTTETSIPDSDSIGTIGSVKYCTDTPSTDFQVVSTDEASWESLRTFQDEDFFDDTDDDKVIGVMQSVFSDDQMNTVGQDCEETVSGEIGSYWTDNLDLDEFGLLDPSLFLPII